MKEDKFERLILGIPTKDERLRELQVKAKEKGLRGDEVFEFIHLDRKELTKKIERLKFRNQNYLSELSRTAVTHATEVQELRDMLMLCRGHLMNYLDKCKAENCNQKVSWDNFHRTTDMLEEEIGKVLDKIKGDESE